MIHNFEMKLNLKSYLPLKTFFFMGSCWLCNKYKGHKFVFVGNLLYFVLLLLIVVISSCCYSFLYGIISRLPKIFTKCFPRWCLPSQDGNGD